MAAAASAAAGGAGASAGVVATDVVASRTLYTAKVESKGRLISISCEAYGWWQKGTEISDPDVKDNYLCIAKAVRDIAITKAGLVKAVPDKLAEQEFIAVYDQYSALQAVATFTLGEGKTTAKIHKVATAIWNLTRDASKGEPCKGAGMAAILKTAEVVRARVSEDKPAFLFLETTRRAQGFYEKCGFTVVKGWIPREEGCRHGMSFEITAENCDKLRAKLLSYGASIVSIKKGDEPPPTYLHFRDVYYPRLKDKLSEAE